MWIFPDHSVERHGLFVMIALGETLIVAGSGGGGQGVDWIATHGRRPGSEHDLWSLVGYFHRAKPALEHAIASSQGPALR